MMVNRAVARIIAGVAALAAGSLVQAARAQEHEAPESHADVLQGIKAVDEPTRTFLPKYRHELFAVGGYTGTFTTAERQWPTLVLGVEWLPLRPGCFDFGVYADWHVGRSDEKAYGRFSSAFGLEVMWRVVEDSFWDLAPLIRGGYVLNWENTDRVLLRPGVGVQVSLLRFAALQATVDGLFSPERKFTNDERALFGFSLALKLGIAPLFDRWPQYRAKTLPTVDRSRVVCEDAARSCEAAGHANVRDALCDAALNALDAAKYSAGWGDPTGPYLDALKTEVGAHLPGKLDAALKTLCDDHRSSVEGLTRYAEKQRALGEDQVLNKNYSYLVTPVMIRDWLGCDPEGHAALACPGPNVCERDTGVSTPR